MGNQDNSIGCQLNNFKVIPVGGSIYTSDNFDPEVSITKTATDEIPAAGQDVTYTVTITNNSSFFDPLTITSLVDDMFGSVLSEAETQCNGGNTIVLVSGTSCTFTFTRFTSGVQGAFHTNTITVVGQDDEGVTATASDSHSISITPELPTIELYKTTNGPLTEPGGLQTFSFEIYNSGSNPLTVTSLLDDQFGDIYPELVAQFGPAPIVLQPSTFVQFPITRDLGILDAGSVHQNTVTVNAIDPFGVVAIASDTYTEITLPAPPSVTINKGGPATTNLDQTSASFTFEICNTSVSTDLLTVDSLADDMLGDLLPFAQSALSMNPIVIPSGGCVYFVYPTDIPLAEGETHTNLVTVAASDDEGTQAFATDSHTITGGEIQPPSIAVFKDVTTTVFSNGVNSVTYSVTITNDSLSQFPVTVNSIVDNMFGDLLPEALAFLGVDPIVITYGQSVTFEFVRDVTLAPGESHTNIVSASASDQFGQTATDSDSETISLAPANPSVSIQKLATGEVPAPGAAVPFTFIITNNGDMDLDVTSLVDSQFGDIYASFTASCGGTLTVGQQCAFVIIEDLNLPDGGNHVNTVVVEAEDANNTVVSDTDSATVTVVPDDGAPSVDVAKSASPSVIPAGVPTSVTYTITVTNTSSATDPVTILSNNDNMFGPQVTTPPMVGDTIAPGQTNTYTFTETITLGVGETHSNRFAVFVEDDEGVLYSTTSPPAIVTASDDGTPSATVTKSASVVDVPAGVVTPVTFTISITNTSSATDPITITSATDSFFSFITFVPPIIGDTIAPGQTKTYTFVKAIQLSSGQIHTNNFTIGFNDDEGNGGTAISNTVTIPAVGAPGPPTYVKPDIINPNDTNTQGQPGGPYSECTACGFGCSPFLQTPMAAPLTITSCYGWRDGSAFGVPDQLHEGIDFFCAEEEPIFATAGGTVTFFSDGCLNGDTFCNGWSGGNGLQITHTDGTCTVYAHFTQSGPFPGGIGLGSTIVAGQLIGFCGTTGASTGPHLHYSVQSPCPGPGVFTNNVDPCTYCGAGTPSPPCIYYQAATNSWVDGNGVILGSTSNYPQHPDNPWCVLDPVSGQSIGTYCGDV